MEAFWDISHASKDQAPKGTFGKRVLPPREEDVRELEETIQEPLLRALARVDYLRVRQLLGDFQLRPDLLYHRTRGLVPPEQAALFSFLLLRRNYSELLKEISHAELLAVLLEHRDAIGKILSLETLPEIDRQIATTAEIEKLIIKSRETDYLREAEGGTRYLHQLSEERIVSFIREARTSSEAQKNDPKSKALRVIAATGKMAVGGSFAAANIALGVFAGVFATLPTLGLGTVASTVGIVTSAYTGLNSACEGLKDLAKALE